MINYFPKGKEPTHNEFTSPLINLIDCDRLDIFERKVLERKKSGAPKEVSKEKGFSPLLYAAVEGKAGFVAVLIEQGTKIMEEKDNEGRNAIHLAAMHGKCVVLRYLFIFFTFKCLVFID